MTLKPYTVVLLRPEYLTIVTDEQYGKDIYVGLMMAENQYNAIELAQLEVFNSDKDEGLHPLMKSDYELCILFEGLHDPKLFGWQV